MYHIAGLGAVAKMGDAEMVNHASEALGFLGIPMFVTTENTPRAQFEARMNLYKNSRGFPAGWSNAQVLQGMVREIVGMYGYFSVMDSDQKAQQAMNVMNRGSYTIPEIPDRTVWDIPVRRLQTYLKLPVTGYFDAATKASLRNALLGWLATQSYWITRMIQQEAPVVSSVYTPYGR